MKSGKVSAVLAALLIIPAAAWSEDNIQTDRPDFVESSNTVGKGVFQLETSVSFSSDKSNGVTVTESSTPTLFRYGTSENVELRFETAGRMSQTSDDPANPPKVTESGYADYSLGLKWHQQDGDDASGSPSVGWLFHLDMAAGTGGFSSDKVRPSIRGVAEWELSNGYSLGVMPGLIYDVNGNNERFYGMIFGAVVGKSFSDDLRGFVEFAGEEITSASNGGSNVALNAGFAYLLNSNVQLDMAVSRGLSQYTPDYSLGAGFSMRFK